MRRGRPPTGRLDSADWTLSDSALAAQFGVTTQYINRERKRRGLPRVRDRNRPLYAFLESHHADGLTLDQIRERSGVNISNKLLRVLLDRRGVVYVEPLPPTRRLAGCDTRLPVGVLAALYGVDRAVARRYRDRHPRLPQWDARRTADVESPEYRQALAEATVHAASVSSNKPRDYRPAGLSENPEKPASVVHLSM